MSDVCPLAPGSRVISYLRVSTSDQADKGTPIASLRHANEQYCERWQLAQVRVFEDAGKSAKSVAGRDDYSEMMDFCRQKPRPADGVIFWRLDRAWRNAAEGRVDRTVLRQLGYKIIYLAEYVPDDKYGPLIEEVRGLEAESQRIKAAEDCIRSQAMFAEAGYWPSGQVPRGYVMRKEWREIDGDRYQVNLVEPNPAEAPHVLKIFELYAEGYTLRQIITTLPELHLNRPSLRYILSNPTYIGTITYRGIVREDCWEAIVPKPLFNEVQRMLLDTSNRYRARLGTKQSYLLSGLLYCAVCGARMHGAYMRESTDHRGWHNKAYRYYRCNTRNDVGIHACPSRNVSADRLEDVVLRHVLTEYLTAQNLRQIADDIAREAESEELPQKITDMERRLKQVEGVIARLLDALESGEMATIRQRLIERERERTELKVNLASLRDKLAAGTGNVSDAAIDTIIRLSYEVLLGTNIEEKQRHLRQMIERIDYDGDAHITYRNPFGS